jgi:SH3 domain-containing YSC84-like protein 1
MTMHLRLAAATAVGLLLAAGHAHAADPAQTMVHSEQVLAELIAIPGKQIPVKLLREAQGIVIVPRVIKIGFVAGGRRGHGVVLVRDAEGAWSLPRFITLTGGSVGWQVGVQGADVVLVFRTQQSVHNLLKGKFTIGVDAAAAAGPVGRNAAAATDVSLKSEILSYSRSRGLFVGASIDGSALEIDSAANTAFYGSPDPATPHFVPESSMKLQSYVSELTNVIEPAPVALQPAAAGPASAPLANAPATPAPANFSAVRVEALRQSLAVESARLAQLLDPQWQTYLALPAATFQPNVPPNPAEFAAAYARYEQLVAAPQYAALVQRPEFQAAMELLREYAAALQSASSTLQLPAPPPAPDGRR